MNHYNYGGYYKKRLVPVELVEKIIDIDWHLFEQVLNFRSYSKSTEQDAFADWLGNWCTSQGATVWEDEYGNVYAMKGEAEVYPCTVAHIDINQSEVRDARIFRTEDIVFGMDNATGEQCGLGFDDKCGVYFAMEMLRTYDNIKCYFAKDEEVGCLGTNMAHMDFFRDCAFLIQLDRNSHANDVSRSTNGIVVVSPEFELQSKSILRKYDYDYAYCMYTDVGELVKQNCGCCAINVSCGYLHEHMSEEILMINHFINAIHFGNDMIRMLGNRRWAWEPKSESRRAYGNRTYNSYDDWYDNRHDDRPAKEKATDIYPWEWDDATQEWIENPKPAKSRKLVYHHSDHFRFEPSDNEFVDDCLDIGQCPVCEANTIVELQNGASICPSCDSGFNIPIGTPFSTTLNMALAKINKQKKDAQKKGNKQEPKYLL